MRLGKVRAEQKNVKVIGIKTARRVGRRLRTPKEFIKLVSICSCYRRRPIALSLHWGAWLPNIAF